MDKTSLNTALRGISIIIIRAATSDQIVVFSIGFLRTLAHPAAAV